MTDEDIERFWKRVKRGSEQECWPWLAGKNGGGYGVLYVDRRAILAHRFSLAADRGHAIPKRLFVLHSCDNPKCVNPRHLRMGTQTDNMQDAKSKGRMKFPPPNFVGARPRETYRRGSQVHNSKLTESKVAKLLKERLLGTSYNRLASKFNVDSSVVSDICNGRIWQHVHGKSGAPTIDQVKAVPINTKASAKITADVAREIKLRLAAGETGRSIAKSFDIHFASVSDIKRGLTWRDA